MTFSELESVSKEGLKSFSISWQHHGSSYDWTHVSIAWIGISKVPECACTPHQLGPVWPVGQMEAVCVGRILVEAENLDG